MNAARQVPSTSAGLVIFELVRRKYGVDAEVVHIQEDGHQHTMYNVYLQLICPGFTFLVPSSVTAVRIGHIKHGGVPQRSQHLMAWHRGCLLARALFNHNQQQPRSHLNLHSLIYFIRNSRS
ncbi:hypothetical protein ACJ72_03362 [Emergomyces africanus]|uniref:Uncharacterized protein n=1 Tax=Emergomyces africanus TaxID=1955775 RepID=A0A1B7NZT6_9EURO|nr:hypothetical protein ACJ72_03362 [Emergomyces africanus]